MPVQIIGLPDWNFVTHRKVLSSGMCLEIVEHLWVGNDRSATMAVRKFYNANMKIMAMKLRRGRENYLENK